MTMDILDTISLNNKEFDALDNLILETVQKNDSISTYRLTKTIGLSWSTINLHCHKLEAKRFIYHVIETNMFKRSHLWSAVG